MVRDGSSTKLSERAPSRALAGSPFSAFSLQAKLTLDQIERIKRLMARRCCTQKEAARRFGVSQGTISKIDRGVKTI